MTYTTRSPIELSIFNNRFKVTTIFLLQGNIAQGSTVYFKNNVLRFSGVAFMGAFRIDGARASLAAGGAAAARAYPQRRRRRARGGARRGRARLYQILYGETGG